MIGAENEDYIRFYAKHFVALSCWESIPHSAAIPEQKYCMFSGFVLSVQNEWFLITAGHVLEKIREATEAGCTFSNWQLDDLGANGPKPRLDIDAPPPPDTIPFDYDLSYKECYQNESVGADYAFFHLDAPRYRALLIASGVEPLRENAWSVGLPEVFIKYELLGIPSDLVKESPRPGQVSRHYVSLNIEPIELFVEEKKKRPHLFKGKAPDITQSGLDGFTQLHGMSGSPIFGFGYNASGEIRYWVVALQSSWNRSTQVITGCYVLFLGEYLDYLISIVREKQTRAESEG